MKTQTSTRIRHSKKDLEVETPDFFSELFVADIFVGKLTPASIEVIESVCTIKGGLFFLALLAHPECQNITVDPTGIKIYYTSEEARWGGYWQTLLDRAKKVANYRTFSGLKPFLVELFNEPDERYIPQEDSLTTSLGALKALVESRKKS